MAKQITTEDSSNRYYYEFTTRIVGKQAFAKKLDKFTYGLLYPAFFGNMIYDLLMKFSSESKFNNWTFAAGIGIVLFNTIDYMHLYVDVENSIGRKIQNKSWAYIICDLLASAGLFTAFVLVKNVQTPIGLWIFCLVPFCIALYKRIYYWTKTDRNIMTGFAFICLLFAVIGQINFDQKNLLAFDEYLTIITYVILIAYSVYVFYFYKIFRNSTKQKKIIWLE